MTAVRNLGTTGDATMGWTLTQMDTPGRPAAVASYNGAAPPATWGSNGSSSGTVSTTYNGVNQTVTDQANVARTLQMDGLGRLQQVTEPGSVVTAYAYDALDNLTSVAQSGLPNRTFVYDSLGRLSSAANPESGTTTYHYDAAGNLSSKTDARSITTTYTLDLFGRVTQKSYSGDGGVTPAVTYCYDNPTCGGTPTAPSIGRLTKMSSSVSSTSYVYDALGRVTGSTQTTGGTPYPFGYSYKPIGMDTETYPSSRKVSYDYDTAGRVQGVSGAYNGNSKQYAGGATAINYAPQGGIASMPLGNQLTELRCYNARLQTSSVQLGASTGANCPTGGGLSLGYTYSSSNNNGNVSSMTIAGAGLSSQITQNFGYDGFNRLNSFTETVGNVNQGYGYDNYGNRCVTGWVNPAYSGQTPQCPTTFTNNRWAYTGSTCAGTGAVQYDCAGNQTSVSLGVGGTRQFTYDGENRVVTATIPGMSAIGYVYDGEGRRVQKNVGGVITTYIYDAQGELAEEVGGPTNPLAGQTTYLTSDALGSTRAVTNAGGTVLARYDYAPFGEELNSGMDGRSSPFLSNQYPVPSSDGTDPKFTSKERDSESGLDFFGARYMSSVQGRFTSPDPDNFDARLGVPQSWNMYSYTWNNPLKYRDDDGRAVNLVLAGVGAVAGFVTNAGGYAISQKIRGQSIDWSTALKLGGVGAATGSLAGLTFGASLVAQAGSAVLIGTGANVLNGIGSRAVTGEGILDESAVESDLETGAITSTIGAGVQFVGAVANLPVKPKLPSPLGTVQKQLQRLEKLRAWERQRGALGNRFSAFGSVVSSLISNAGVQINQAYNDLQSWGLSPSWQSFLTFSLWQQQTPNVTSKICYPNNEGGQTCQ